MLNEKNNQTLSNDWPTYCHTVIQYTEEHAFWLFIAVISTCIQQTSEKKPTYN